MADERYITPSDRDYMIRTVMGEAAGQPDEGQAGVGHVIMNRVRRGYGRTPTEVVFAPKQFEPWSTRKNELLGYSADEPAYKRAASIVDGIIGGKIKDPTNGATHFLQEDIVRKRRGGTLPDWAAGQGLKIGGHTFYDPEAPRFASVLDKYYKGGAKVPTTDAAPLAEGLSIVDKYLKKTGQQTPEILDRMTPTPENRGVPEKAMPQWQRDLGQIGSDIAAAPGNFAKSMASNALQGWENIKQGVGDTLKGDVLPSGVEMKKSKITNLLGNEKEVSTPVIQNPGGPLRAVGGAMQSAASIVPIIPATEMLEGGVANLTGNPEIGKRAGFVGNAFTSGMIGRGVNRLRPETRAKEYVGETRLTPEEIARLDANSKLMPIDINPTLEGQASKLTTMDGKGKNTILGRLTQRSNEAPGRVSEAYTTLAGEPPIVTETLRGFQQTAKTNAQKGFGDAFKTAKPVNATPVIEAIDAQLKPGVTAVASPGTQLAWGPLEQRLAKLKQELTDGTSVVTDPARLHEIQYTLGREIRELKTSATKSEHKLGRDLQKVNEKLVDQIDAATGGKYRPAREKFRSDMEVTEAFERGFDLFRNKAGLKGALEDSPDAWREWVTGKDSKGNKIGNPATAEELAATQLGARAAVEQQIQGFRQAASNPAAKGLSLETVPYNQQKMALLFGEKEAKRLHDLFRDERDMGRVSNKLRFNSKTAEALQSGKGLEPRELSTPLNMDKLAVPALAEAASWYLSGGAAPGVAAGVSIAARHVANRLGRRSDLARNEIMADILSSGESAGVRQSQVAAASGNRLLGPPSSVRLPGTNIKAPVPFTYVPEDYRAKRVPLTKD